jgi:DHA2 family multidrug resistance protein
MLQSFGLAFLFIPINVAAFAYVPRDKTNMGTGIINLARNIGASVGIATVTTMLQRRSQVHQAPLTAHVSIATGGCLRFQLNNKRQAAEWGVTANN